MGDQASIIHRPLGVFEPSLEKKQNMKKIIPNQDFVISWGKQKEHTFQNFCEFAEKDLFTDLIIWAGDKKFKTHKIILASASRYFKDLLSNFKSQQSIIYFRSFPEQYMQMILTYIYTGKCVVQARYFKDFLQSAKLLQIYGLTFDLTKFTKFKEFKIYQPEVISKSFSTGHSPQVILANSDTLNPTGKQSFTS